MNAAMTLIEPTPSVPAAAPERRNLIGLSREQLVAMLAELGEKPFRAKQLWSWIYNRGVTDFAAMTDLAKPFRALLDRHFVVSRPEMAREQISSDGTRKWLLRFADGNEAEAVYIPDDDRGAVCVSAQVGCTLTCRFCHTGTQLLVRNLTAAEIIGQFMVARDAYGEWPSPTAEAGWISKRVLIGIGEPLYNYSKAASALNNTKECEGLAVPKRRITLSTSGVVPMIRRCGAELGVNLAISLHAVTDEVRDRIMPINKKYPLAELMLACREYPGLSNARRITFEYVMLKGVNDSMADARALVALIKDIPAKFNLIPFNKWPGSEFDCSDMADIQRFSDYLFDAGYSAPIRQPRGRDILAACGQLKSDSQRVRCSLMKERQAAGIIDEHHPDQASP